MEQLNNTEFKSASEETLPSPPLWTDCGNNYSQHFFSKKSPDDIFKGIKMLIEAINELFEKKLKELGEKSTVDTHFTINHNMSVHTGKTIPYSWNISEFCGPYKFDAADDAVFESNVSFYTESTNSNRIRVEFTRTSGCSIEHYRFADDVILSIDSDLIDECSPGIGFSREDHDWIIFPNSKMGLDSNNEIKRVNTTRKIARCLEEYLANPVTESVAIPSSITNSENKIEGLFKELRSDDVESAADAFANYVTGSIAKPVTKPVVSSENKIERLFKELQSKDVESAADAFANYVISSATD
jgi:hypothetical protein